MCLLLKKITTVEIIGLVANQSSLSSSSRIKHAKRERERDVNTSFGFGDKYGCHK